MNTSPSNTAGDWNETTLCTAFDGNRRIASGPLAVVAAKAKGVIERRGDRAAVLIFNDLTAHPIEVDFRGSVHTVVARLPKAPPPPPANPAESGEPPSRGRPKLGVVAREVTLLPRHWEWLNTQPGGASVALRKLVEAARRANALLDHKRQSQESAYRFMVAMAGNQPGFEEATRALFAADAPGFRKQTAAWPKDVQIYARRLAQVAMEAAPLDAPPAPQSGARRNSK
jgi:uncharacterized protein